MTRDIAIKCPVCLGKCKDEHGVDCKPCAGMGILWGKETDDVTPAPLFVPQPYPVPCPQPFQPWPYGPIWQVIPQHLPSYTVAPVETTCASTLTLS